jgi:hypothetical protein
MSEARTPMQVKRELKARMKELKPMLHRGAHQDISKKLSVSASFVSEVVAGRRWDLKVIEALIEVGETNLKRAIAASKKLDKIVTENRKTTQG